MGPLRGMAVALTLGACGCLVEYVATDAGSSTASSTGASETATAGPNAASGDTTTAATDPGTTASGTEGETDGCTMCGDVCVDIDDDPEHCGACDSPCAPGDSCRGGRCVSACAPECDPDAELCVAGACACKPGLAACGGVCVDPGSDAGHCGACGLSCARDPCIAGACGPGPCEPPLQECGELCVDIERNPLHCGRCDHACGDAAICVAGDCVDVTVGACDTCPCRASCEPDTTCCARESLTKVLCVEGQGCPPP